MLFPDTPPACAAGRMRAGQRSRTGLRNGCSCLGTCLTPTLYCLEYSMIIISSA